MRLEDELYSVVSYTTSFKGVAHTVSLLPESRIFKAHFPGKPVTPGVCLIQMAVEMLETEHNLPLILDQVRKVKFLRAASPDEVRDLTFDFTEVEIDSQRLKAKVLVSGGNAVYTKMELSCRIV